MNRRFGFLTLFALLAMTAPARARPHAVEPPAPVRVGRAALGTSAGGHAVVLVSVTYPIQLVAHAVPVRIEPLDPAGERVEARRARIRLKAGKLRSPERRRSFTFVHRLDLFERRPQELEAGMRVRIRARGRLDANGDGKPEVRDISPVYPSSFSCSRFGYEVDGRSVQSTVTQTELKILHPLSFCRGPAGGGPPWVISGDTGIHPSAAGYAQMASRAPAPGE